MKNLLKVYSLLTVLSNTLTNVIADPTVGLPFDQQLPDVARVGEAYTFVINSQTIESTNEEQITYKTDQLPDWLSFDSNSLTLSGTPSANDSTDALQFYLIGSDSTGSYNETCTIVVSSDPGPVINKDDSVSSQLLSFGETDGDDGIILSPNEDFSFKFDSNTFEMSSGSSNKIKEYYGRFTNRTSLPSWIYFDSNSLTFSGTAPTVNSEIAPSMEFGFVLIATDYSGYTGTYITFNILVGAHTLTTNLTDSIIINGTAGNSFSEKIPLNDIFLDGNQVNSSDITSVTISDSPSWVSAVDNSEISGTIPSDDDSNDLLNVTITDIHGNSVFLNFEIQIIDEIFTIDSLPDVNATRGNFFEYTLDSDDFTDLNDTDLSASFDDSTWLNFYYTNHTFTGLVPDNFDDLDVKLTATMDSLSESRSFKIKGVGKVLSSSSRAHSSSSMSRTASSSTRPSSTSSYSPSSSTATSTSSSSSGTPISGIDKGKKNNDSKKKLAIGLGVGLGALALIALLLLFLCCFRRRKNNKENDGSDSPNDNEKGVSSDPMFINPDGSNSTLNNYTSHGGEDDDMSSAKRLSALNVLKLNDKNGLDDNFSETTNVEEPNSLYNDAINYQSTDMLVGAGAGATAAAAGGLGGNKITKSWRQSNWKARDSLNSLATVATNDLLTVRVADDPNIQRRSQLDFFTNLHNANANNDRGGSLVNSDSVDSSLSNYQVYDNEGRNIKVRSTDLHTVSEENHDETIAALSSLDPGNLKTKKSEQSMTGSSTVSSDLNEYSNETFHSALTSNQRQPQINMNKQTFDTSLSHSKKDSNDTSNSAQLVDFENKVYGDINSNHDEVSIRGVIEDNSDSSML